MRESGKLNRYKAWDRTTRAFHWVNALCVLMLAVLGIAILNEKAFGVSSDGKILLKTLHAYVGYVFAVNLAWRFIWAFVGSPTARWGAVLPRRGFMHELRRYVAGFKEGTAPAYLGHNPLGRLMVSMLLLMLLIQGTTGLVLAGTDLYKPPFGGVIANWVTEGDPNKLAHLEPGSKDYVVPGAYEAMRSFRKPIVTTHLYLFYALMVTIVLHVAGVIVTDIREKQGLISAMVTGEKVLANEPVDSAMETAPQAPVQ